MTVPTAGTISLDELAWLARTEREEVELLARMGFLAADEQGRYRRGDVHRIRIIEDFRGAGIELEALRAAYERGLVTFAYYDQLHPEPRPPSSRTYEEVRRDLGEERSELLGRLLRALSLPEPEPSSRLTEEDEDLVLRLLDVIESTGADDLGLRVARLFGEGLRRSMEAVLGVYGEAAERAAGSVSGIPSEDVYERLLRPWSGYARIAPELGRWLTERHLSDAIDAFSVGATERFLMDQGLVPPREEVPPAVAFVDLAGFTRMASERGDEPAAQVALDFGQLAADTANAYSGRLVKLLGDGALLHFDSSSFAIEATLGLLDALPGVGLPPGHAGIDAGPVVRRDGDVFGRTVNLAARLSDRAEAGWVLCSAAAARAAAPGDRYRFEPLGAEALSGFPEPIEIMRVLP